LVAVAALAAASVKGADQADPVQNDQAAAAQNGLSDAESNLFI
jgi:hypothetical protein